MVTVRSAGHAAGADAHPARTRAFQTCSGTIGTVLLPETTPRDRNARLDIGSRRAVRGEAGQLAPQQDRTGNGGQSADHGAEPRRGEGGDRTGPEVAQLGAAEA